MIPRISNRWRGVNLSGGEFGSNVPGAYNTDYTYPSNAEIDYYTGKGFNVFRIPFLYQRLQKDTIQINALIDYIASKKAYAVMDWHNYGKDQNGNLIAAGSSTPWVQAWTWMANQWKAKPAVIFGLMNEPNQQTPTVWFQAANAAISAIRAAGAFQLILVPGSAWTGAWTWVTSGNSAAAVTVADPNNYYAYEVHQYLCADGSGNPANPPVSGAGSTRLVAATTWAKSQGAYLWLGEFGSTNTPAYITELNAMLSYMDANPDVWLGWTYWAGGPWWGNYAFSCEPVGTADSAQTQALVAHLPVAPPPVTPPSSQALAFASALQQLVPAVTNVINTAAAYVLSK